ncbi:MAG: replicative DNA helicase [Deltaproteobacteria bacterium]|nr:replicative DNA helicase [Candidatus Zymogenaceae bacterium]
MANERLRVPPQSIESEMAVLGGILIDNDQFPKVLDMIGSGDFYRVAHGKIFSSMVNLYNQTEPVDLVTVTDELRKNNNLDAAGGAAYISSLVDNTPTAANIEYYARIVREKSILRRIILVCNETIADAFTDSRDPEEIINSLASQIIGLGIYKDRTEHIRNPLKREYARIGAQYERLRSGEDKQVPGYLTGFENIDSVYGGIQKKTMHVVAGRPGSGKTAFLANVIGCFAQQAPVLFFSLDQQAEEFARRLIVFGSKVDNYRVRDGYVRNEEWSKIISAIDEYYEYPIYINDDTNLNIQDVVNITQKHKHEHGVGILIVDYLQMIRRPGRDTENNELGEISSRLKALGKELDMGVMVLSQLNRNPAARKDEMPNLTDLRGSGVIEQDAHTVALLHWDPKSKTPGVLGEGMLKYIIAKNKDGKKGTLSIDFKKPIYQMIERDWED